MTRLKKRQNDAGSEKPSWYAVALTAKVLLFFELSKTRATFCVFFLFFICICQFFYVILSRNYIKSTFLNTLTYKFELLCVVKTADGKIPITSRNVKSAALR